MSSLALDHASDAAAIAAVSCATCRRERGVKFAVHTCTACGLYFCYRCFWAHGCKAGAGA
jgi:hypothetical protein